MTTQDVARAAGVHASTVSRALRGVSGVSREEKQRIRAVADQLGYRPNPFVSAFTAQVRAYRHAPHAATIAVLDCWPERRPVWAHFDRQLDYLGGIRQRAEALGYTPERISFSDFGNSAERLNRMLVTRRIHGLLVLPVPRGIDLQALDFSRLACATIDFSLHQPALMRRVSSNYYYNMSLALNMLASRGYRRIGLVIATGQTEAQDRLGLSAFLAHRFLHPRTCVAPCLAPAPELLSRTRGWLKREHPDAIVTSDLTLPDDLETLGVKVPRDMACVSVTSLPPGHRPLAHVDENCPESGARAVDMIVDAIHRNDFDLPSSFGIYFVNGVWREGPTLRPALPT